MPSNMIMFHFSKNVIREIAEHYKSKIEFDIVGYLQREQLYLCYIKILLKLFNTRKSEEIKNILGFEIDHSFLTYKKS